MSARHMVTVEREVESLDSGDDDMIAPLQAVIADLQAALAEIPEERRDSARLRVYGTGDGSVNITVEVRHERPETDDEMAARERRDSRYARQQQERELEEYRRLRAKFGGEA